MSPRREVLAPSERPAASTGPAAANEPAGSSSERLVQLEAEDGEVALEAGLRPRKLDDFVGQGKIREHLRVMLEAARQRGEPSDHLLFAGPPGLGKTTLAGIVAAEMGAGLRVTSGPALTRGGDLAALLTELQPGDVLFIDEIHRLNRAVEEILYPAMEDRQIDIVLGKGPTARSVRLDLPPFTLVGATTRTGLLTGPLRDRFGFVESLQLYEPAELEQIVHRNARLFGVSCDAAGASEIASRSRGTPRLAIRLLRRVRDFAEVRGHGAIDREAARAACELFGVDELGLDQLDLRLLEILCVRFGGRPIGLTTLAVSVGEEPETVEEVCEPYLLQAGLLVRTPRGRVPGPLAWAHLGIADPGEVPPVSTGAGDPDGRPRIEPPPGLFEIEQAVGRST